MHGATSINTLGGGGDEMPAIRSSARSEKGKKEGKKNGRKERWKESVIKPTDRETGLA